MKITLIGLAIIGMVLILFGVDCIQNYTPEHGIASSISWTFRNWFDLYKDL